MNCWQVLALYTCNLTESVNFWIRLAIIIAATVTANFMSMYVYLQ